MDSYFMVVSKSQSLTSSANDKVLLYRPSSSCALNRGQLPTSTGLLPKLQQLSTARYVINRQLSLISVSRPPVHKFDPFAYALFRFAILLFPLTTAAPAHWADALATSGDGQGRALGAGLLAALIGSERLGAQA
jgi:hypothetical protein